MAFAGRLIADHGAVANQDSKVGPVGRQVLDPVRWSGLDTRGQHAAERAEGFGDDWFEENLPSCRFVGGGDDALVGEVLQKRRCVDRQTPGMRWMPPGIWCAAASAPTKLEWSVHAPQSISGTAPVNAGKSLHHRQVMADEQVVVPPLSVG